LSTVVNFAETESMHPSQAGLAVALKWGKAAMLDGTSCAETARIPSPERTGHDDLFAGRAVDHRALELGWTMLGLR
jgi:hypothetical protein